MSTTTTDPTDPTDPTDTTDTTDPKPEAENEYKFGWVADLPDHRDYLYAVRWMPLEEMTTLPKEVNLTAKFPPVYDQGSLGSCTANAIGAAFEYEQHKLKLSSWTPSRLFIYYNERAMDGNELFDSGARIRDGIKSIANDGAPPEYCWPYDISKFTVKPPVLAYEEALRNTATSYTRLNNTNMHELKTCLAAGFPWIFGFSVYSSFMSIDETGVVPMPRFGDEMQGGHAIVAVGYNDDVQYFKFRNSWGTQWGDHGYGYMPYTYVSNPNLARDFWTIRSVSGTPMNAKSIINCKYKLQNKT